MECMPKHAVSFVSVTQQFNTTRSMGRLTLNVLLSFAQFEREVTSERIRDKIAAQGPRSRNAAAAGRAARLRTGLRLTRGEKARGLR
jgi:DNA invertase Pin-like site-specific DNA recombinase